MRCAPSGRSTASAFPATARRWRPILTAFNASTLGDGAFARLEHAARALERQPGILSVSNFYVGSYIDLPEMSCGSLVIADGDPALARREAKRLARQFWDDKAEFLV